MVVAIVSLAISVFMMLAAVETGSLVFGFTGLFFAALFAFFAMLEHISRTHVSSGCEEAPYDHF